MKKATLQLAGDDLETVAREERPSSSARRPMEVSTNPYLAAKLEWNERYGDVISRAQNWRILALVCAAASVVLAAGLVIVALRSRIVPYVVSIDTIGRAVSAGPAERAKPADERLVRAAVLDWVEAMRTVTSDPQLQMHAIDKVFAMIGKGSPAQTFVTDYYKANSPFERAASVTVNVEVRSVLASSDKTFQVEWTETTRDLQGGIKETGTYNGSFTTVVNPPSDERTVRLNPLGVYITYVNWSKVL